MKHVDKVIKLIEEINKEVQDKVDIYNKNYESILTKLLESIAVVNRSWSNSNLGYHALLYYGDFEPVPAEDLFNVEWGMMPNIMGETYNSNKWQSKTEDEVKKFIEENANNPDIDTIINESEEIEKIIDKQKQRIITNLSALNNKIKDEVIKNQMEGIKKIRTPSKSELLNSISSKGQILTRDTRALSQGTVYPPHKTYHIYLLSIKSTISNSQKLLNLLDSVKEYLSTMEDHKTSEEIKENRIFIGHGRSKIWIKLKEFLVDRLELDWVEFNRESTAGLSTKERLEEMLKQSNFAFLVFTGEDIQSDSTYRARENVVHEAGLYQGRLGFKKAIILLEEGCEEFSNIVGLGQIRFPKGDILSKSEEIRKVLEREDII